MKTSSLKERKRSRRYWCLRGANPATLKTIRHSTNEETTRGKNRGEKKARDKHRGTRRSDAPYSKGQDRSARTTYYARFAHSELRKHIPRVCALLTSASVRGPRGFFVLFWAVSHYDRPIMWEDACNVRMYSNEHTLQGPRPWAREAHVWR